MGVDRGTGRRRAAGQGDRARRVVGMLGFARDHRQPESGWSWLPRLRLWLARLRRTSLSRRHRGARTNPDAVDADEQPWIAGSGAGLESAEPPGTAAPHAGRRNPFRQASAHVLHTEWAAVGRERTDLVGP